MDDIEKKKERDDLLEKLDSYIGGQLEVIHGEKMGFVLTVGEFESHGKYTIASCTKRDAVRWMLEATLELADYADVIKVLFEFMTRVVIKLLKNGYTEELRNWLDTAEIGIKTVENLDKTVKFDGPKIK